MRTDSQSLPWDTQYVRSLGSPRHGAERTIDRLIARGILLEPGDDGFPSLSPEVAHARRYPATDGVAQEHIRLRVMRVLFSDEIPDPADIVIISPIHAVPGVSVEVRIGRFAKEIADLRFRWLPAITSISAP